MFRAEAPKTRQLFEKSRAFATEDVFKSWFYTVTTISLIVALEVAICQAQSGLTRAALGALMGLVMFLQHHFDGALLKARPCCGCRKSSIN